MFTTLTVRPSRVSEKPTSNRGSTTDHTEGVLHRQPIPRKPETSLGCRPEQVSAQPSFSICVLVSRFHVVSLEDGLDRQVAHAWVFGKVAFGPELVLQHLSKVADILTWSGLKGRAQWRLCSHTNAPFSPGRSHISGPFAFIYTSSEVELMPLLLAKRVSLQFQERGTDLWLSARASAALVQPRCTFQEITF